MCEKRRYSGSLVQGQIAGSGGEEVSSKVATMKSKLNNESFGRAWDGWCEVMWTPGAVDCALQELWSKMNKQHYWELMTRSGSGNPSTVWVVVEVERLQDWEVILRSILRKLWPFSARGNK